MSAGNLFHAVCLTTCQHCLTASILPGLSRDDYPLLLHFALPNVAVSPPSRVQFLSCSATTCIPDYALSKRFSLSRYVNLIKSCYWNLHAEAGRFAGIVQAPETQASSVSMVLCLCIFLFSRAWIRTDASWIRVEAKTESLAPVLSRLSTMQHLPRKCPGERSLPNPHNKDTQCLKLPRN